MPDVLVPLALPAIDHLWTRTIRVEHTKSGQEGPYKDTIREGYITYTGTSRLEAADHTMREYEHTISVDRAKVLLDVTRFFGAYVYPRRHETFEDGMRPYLDILQEETPGRWHVLIREPYND